MSAFINIVAKSECIHLPRNAFRVYKPLLYTRGGPTGAVQLKQLLHSAITHDVGG